MTHYCILRATKLTTYGNLAASGQHTWRERETRNADPALTHLNTDHAPATCAAELAAAVSRRVALAEQKAERPVLCIEYLITATPEALDAMTERQREAYFLDSLKYFEAKHGKDNIVAANIQRDESTQHLVVYAVPLVQTVEHTRRRSVIVGTHPDGTKRRETREFTEKASSKLSAAAFLDGPAKLSRMQTTFAKEVGAKHGLERGLIGSKAHHQEVSAFMPSSITLPQVGNIEVPEPSLKDRIDPQAYGDRVKHAVIEQIRPSYNANEAKAKAHDAAMKQVAEAKATAKSALVEAAAERKRADQYRTSADRHYAVASLFTPEEIEWASQRKQREDAEKARLAKIARQEAAKAARCGEIAAEVLRRTSALKTSPRGLGGAAYTFHIEAQKALSAVGGDGSKVDWTKVDSAVAVIAMSENGQRAEDVTAVILNMSPARADPDTHARVGEWMQAHAPSLLAQYQQEREQRQGRDKGLSQDQDLGR